MIILITINTVAQPERKKHDGKIIEKLGYWRPRTQASYDRAYVINRARISYWLGNGAQPTISVHKILEEFGMVPKMPPIFGSKHTYKKPEKEFTDTTMEVWRMTHKWDKDPIVKQRLEQELKTMEGRLAVENDLYDPVPVEEVQTTDIDSDEPSVFERNIKFEELRKRFDNHKEYSLNVLGGNDYRLNIYLRKMNKLSRSKYGGLDVEGYKDYLNNLLQFKKIKANFRPDNFAEEKF